MPRQSRPRYYANRNQWILRHKKRLHYLCAGANNEALAWKKAAEIMDGGTLDRPVTIVQACEAWLRQEGDDWTKSILTPFILWSAHGNRLNDIHEHTLADYLKHLQRLEKYSPSTLRRQVRYARKVLVWSNVRGYCGKTIPPMPRLPRIPEVARDIEDKNALQEVFRQIPKSARQVLAFIMATGARPAEACLLHHDEIKGDRCELERGKTWKRTGRTRVIYLNDEAKAIIAAQPSEQGFVFRSRLGTPYKSNGLRSIFKRAAERAGLEVAGPYQLRHTFGQNAVDIIGLDAVGEALGHTPGSPETKVYARISRQRTRKAVQSLAAVVPVDLDQEAPRGSSRAEKKRRKACQPKKHKTAKGRRRRAG